MRASKDESKAQKRRHESVLRQVTTSAACASGVFHDLMQAWLEL